MILFWKFFTQCLTKCVGTLLVLPPPSVNWRNYSHECGVCCGVRALLCGVQGQRYCKPCVGALARWFGLYFSRDHLGDLILWRDIEGVRALRLGAKATQAKVASGSRPLVAWMRRSASSGGVGNKPFQWSGSVFRGSPWKLCNSIPLWCRRAAKGKDAFRRAGQFCWFVRGFRTRQLRWSSEAEEWPFVLMIHVRYVNTQII